MFKRAVRWFLAWTSISPFLTVYHFIYKVFLHRAVRSLRKFQSISAIYICRGVAKNQIVPGISDIDLSVFTKNETELAAIRETFARLSRWSWGLIDYYPNLVKTEAILLSDWNSSPAWQYRYKEGRSNWRLLYGSDLLHALPSLDEMTQRSSCYAELNRWWLVFTQMFLATDQHHPDRVLRNATCYKVVSELILVRQALLTGVYEYSRHVAFDTIDIPFTRKLSRISAGRFLDFDDHVLDDTLHFLFEFFRDLWRDFRQHPYLYIYEGMDQRLEASNPEFSSNQQQCFRKIRNCLKTHLHWATGEIHGIKSAFFDLEDALLVIDLRDDIFPSVQEIVQLSSIVREDRADRVFLFLRSGP